MNVLRLLQYVLFICYLPKVIHTNEGKKLFLSPRTENVAHPSCLQRHSG